MPVRCLLLIACLGLAACGEDAPTPKPASETPNPRLRILEEVEHAKRGAPTEDALSVLLAHRQNEEPAIRREAIKAIVVQAMLTRMAAARALETGEAAPAPKGLVLASADQWLVAVAQAFEDPDTEVRTTAAGGMLQALRSGPTELPVALIAEQLEAQRPIVQIELLQILRATGERAVDVAPLLRQLMQKEAKTADQANVRLEAALAHFAVTQIPEPATRILTASLSHEDPGIRQLAVYGVAHHAIGLREQVRLLTPLLEDEDPGVADHAAIGLVRAEAATPEVRARVREIAQDPQNHLQTYARKALGED